MYSEMFFFYDKLKYIWDKLKKSFFYLFYYKHVFFFCIYEDINKSIWFLLVDNKVVFNESSSNWFDN